MPYIELLRVAWNAVRAHKLRSMLTTLGIVMAVWTIVSVFSVMSGMDNYIKTSVITLSPDVFVITRFGIITSTEEFMAAVKRKPISETEVNRLTELCESCSDIGKNLTSTKPVHAGNRRITGVTINGTTANIATLQNLDIEDGRYFTRSESEHAAPVAVIGSEIREELFARVDPIGRSVWIDGYPHRVIGHISKQGTLLGQNQDLVIYTPYRTASKRLGSVRDMNVQLNLLVQAAGGVSNVEQSRDEVTTIFRWLRNTPFSAPDPIGTITGEQLQTLWRTISYGTFFVVFLVSLVSLIVGVIVVANIMFVSVLERTKEIGLRRAMGARQRDIRRQFLVEAITLASLGGVIGTALGGVTAWIVNELSPIPTTLQVAAVVLAMAMAAMSGLVAGIVPAMMASRLSPIEALQRD